MIRYLVNCVKRRGQTTEVSQTERTFDENSSSMANLTKVSIPFSKKNVPEPPRKEYFKKTHNAVSKLVSNMSWEVYQQQNKEKLKDKEKIDHFGFKSTYAPPPESASVLQPFLKELMDLFKNLDFRESTVSKFQNNLNEWISENTKSKEVLVAADKTRNFYSMKATDYKKVLTQNVTETYKKVTEGEVHEENLRAKKLVVKLHEDLENGIKLAKRVEVHSSNNAFITLKDHDSEFRTSKALKCRLINPAKSELGKISKKKLERINREIRSKTQLNQWQSNISVKKWFMKLKNSKSLSFLIFDIKSFYPSITPDLLEKAISWGEKLVKISEQDKEIFREARRALLFHGKEYWKKRKNPEFDVPMGCYDGAEVCELVGLYILEEIIRANIGLTRSNVGIYRDDGLAVTEARDRTGQKMVQRLHQIFQEHDLKLSKCVHGMKSVDFLDLTFHLETQTYEPFRKDGNQPIYIHKQSNHPSNITRNIPQMIEKMISNNSSTEEIFNRHKGIYQEALKKSGYKGDMKYVPTDGSENSHRKTKRERYPKKFYFNPPYNRAVKTNVGKAFLGIVSRCFPKGHPWHKSFNRHTVKLSYSCTKNVASKIAQHNTKVLNGKNISKDSGCNCKKKSECPMPNNCMASNVVYQALLTAEGKTYNYFGMTSMTFKKRYTNHKSDFKNRKEEGKGTALSSKVWELKDTNKKFEIKWSIVDRCHGYKAGAKMCDLCATERTHIALGEKGFKTLPPGCILLNKRSEIMGKCRHQLSQSLFKVKE